MNIFWAPSRPQNPWFSVGLTSSFPDLGSDDGNLLQSRICNEKLTPGCKIFQVSGTGTSEATELQLTEDDLEACEVGDMKDQVLVFQYRGKFHAIDHRCPHSSYPLSNGIPFDIEDFGVVLSAGLTCPKHGWSFDLFLGTGDRGSYKLKTWEVQLRDIKAVETSTSTDEADNASERRVKEVWVRRKQRIG